MKRTLMTALVGASILIPVAADAQRVQNRAGDRRVPPQGSARLAECRAPSGGRAFVCEAPSYDRTVYRYAGRRAPGAARAWVTPGWGRTRYDLRRDMRRGVVTQRWLRDVLGQHTLRRVRGHGRIAGLRGQVRGHWLLRRHGGDVLVLTMEGQEVARIVDRNYDGHTDILLLRNFRDHRRW